MLGPRSRSEIDFLEKKVRKSGKRNNPPWLQFDPGARSVKKNELAIFL